ncbi:winged helix-turn-helix domain-containing protein [Kordiimonas aquimaris]|uniref:winged helix-turn-helix domain-containing protein n=1 Tax=Kordiimonas aquimaris TaxID=707591 RepID=UPI0021D0D939|nr:helix-turn-helix domain-containing protein [Kordiimonas aquimaris]
MPQINPDNVQDESVYWIKHPDQFECLMSARRMEIVDQLAQIGVCSVAEIANTLGVKVSSLYHHIELLLSVGLIECVGKRGVGRCEEKLYRTPGAVMRYGITLGDSSSFDIYRRLSEYQARQATRDFTRGLRSKHLVDAGSQKNIWIFRLVGAPDADTLAKINQHIEAIAELFWSSAGQDNPLVVMSAIVAPVPRAGEETQS